MLPKVSDLKIYKHLPEIAAMVLDNDITIISTPTSSGKTMAVPPMLQEMFPWATVHHTVPRVDLSLMAVEGLLAFHEEDLGGIPSLIDKDPYSLFGVTNGRVSINKKSKIHVYTEMSLLMRSEKIKKGDIIVIDEGHEMGEFCEYTLYEAGLLASKGVKVVVMSATMSLAKMKNYFSNFGSVAVFEMPEPERAFKVERITGLGKSDLITAVLGEGRVLWGVSGEAEAEEVMTALRKAGYRGFMTYWHSQMEDEQFSDMMDAFDGYDDFIVVATVVAMSGVTVKNLDAVVVPTYCKTTVGGRLVEITVSKAEALQWEGRAGRMKDGKAFHQCPMSNRPEEPIVFMQAQGENLTEQVMNCLRFGRDLREMKLLHHPPVEHVISSVEALINAGLAVDTPNGLSLSQKGAEALQIEGPRTVEGRLLVLEGIKLGIEKTAREIAAVIEQGSPFRRYFSGWAKLDDLTRISQHYRAVETIKSSLVLAKIRDTPDPVARVAMIKAADVYWKGVKTITKAFNRIADQYYDEVELTPTLLKTLFSRGMAFNLCEGQVTKITKIKVTDVPSQKCYVTLTPIKLRNGMLPSMWSEAL